jgi:hypothetical protein
MVTRKSPRCLSLHRNRSAANEGTQQAKIAKTNSWLSGSLNGRKERLEADVTYKTRS